MNYKNQIQVAAFEEWWLANGIKYTGDNMHSKEAEIMTGLVKYNFSQIFNAMWSSREPELAALREEVAEQERLHQESIKVGDEWLRELKKLREDVSRLDRSALKYDEEYLSSSSRTVADAIVISLARLADYREQLTRLKAERVGLSEDETVLLNQILSHAAKVDDFYENGKDWLSPGYAMLMRESPDYQTMIKVIRALLSAQQSKATPSHEGDV